VGCCQHGHELSDSTDCGEFIEQLKKKISFAVRTAFSGVSIVSALVFGIYTSLLSLSFSETYSVKWRTLRIIYAVGIVGCGNV